MGQQAGARERLSERVSEAVGNIRSFLSQQPQHVQQHQKATSGAGEGAGAKAGQTLHELLYGSPKTGLALVQIAFAVGPAASCRINLSAWLCDTLKSIELLRWCSDSGRLQ